MAQISRSVLTSPFPIPDSDPTDFTPFLAMPASGLRSEEGGEDAEVGEEVEHLWGKVGEMDLLLYRAGFFR